jgi:general secretion pathway protein D
MIHPFMDVGDALSRGRRVLTLGLLLVTACVSARPSPGRAGSDTQISTSPQLPAIPPPLEGKVQRNPDGTLTRFFYVRPGRAEILMDLIQNHAKLSTSAITPKPSKETYKPDNVNPPKEYPIYDLLIVTATEDQIQAIEDFIEMMEAQTPLVEIEAKVVEITSTDDFQLGAITEFRDVKRDGEGNPQTTFDSAIGRFNTPNALLAIATNSVFEGQLLELGTIQSGIAVNVLIQALVAKGYAEILSAPRITVLNGYPAQIVTGQEVPVSTVRAVGSTIVVDVSFKQTGVKLLVIPFIIGRNSILLDVQPEVSAVVGFTQAGARGLQNPIVNNRSARTVVTVGNGDTYVIGGLITNSDIDDELKTPILGDIPIIGALFRTTRKRNAATQLIFFITPRIIPMSGTGTKRLIIPPDDRGG